jgi:methylmalonyl-CoA/ethylmalonyl-CoA epimerase
MYELDHVGIAVSNLEESIRNYKDNFGFELVLRERVESQQTEIAFLKLSNTLLELLAPINGEGAVARFLQKRGPGMHHVCYKVDNIEQELARLEARGCQLIDRVPRPGAHNTAIAFIHPSSMGGVLTELCEHRKET